MFERQIRLSRYDSDKISNASISQNSRSNNQHRELSSPTRSRSVSPNDMALRQRRSVPFHSTNSVAQSVAPAVTSFPDVVTSHTPLASIHTDINKVNSEVIATNEQKRKCSSSNVIPDETTNINTNQNRTNGLVSNNASSDTNDYHPLDFKSRLALFNRSSNTSEQKNVNSHIPNNVKKPSVMTQKTPPAPPNLLTKPILHHHSDKKDNSLDSITRPNNNNVTTSKSVTFFGGAKVDGTIITILPTLVPSSSSSITNEEQSFVSASSDSLLAPDIVGGNMKLSKSSIYSGSKKVLINFYKNFMLLILNLGDKSQIY